MRFLPAALCALSIALLAGCGEGDTAGPAALVPAESAVYVQLTLDPDDEQEEAVRDIAGRFPGGEDIDAQIERLISEGLREDGLDYAKDVKPWLGDEAVAFVGSVRENGADGAVIVQTTDEDATRSAFEKGSDKPREREHEGADYLLDDEVAAGVVDGNAVIGTERAFKQVVDASQEGGESIEDSNRVKDSLEPLDDDALASFYFDGRKLLGSAGLAGGLIAPFAEIFEDPYVFGVSAEKGAVVVDSTVPRALTAFAAPLFFGSGTEAVRELPANAWYAVGSPEVGKTLLGLVRRFGGIAGGQDQIERQVRAATGLDLGTDILGWMGDLGGYVGGTSLAKLAAGAVIQSKDPATSRRTILALGRLARREADRSARVLPLRLRGGGAGFTVESGELPQPVHVVQRGDRVAVAFGGSAAQALLEPRDTLADDQQFGDAAGRLGDGFEVANYLEVAPVLQLADSLGADSDPDFAKARPYLEPFVRLVAGTRGEGDTVLSRTRVELR